jgi:hypothetical protein
VNTQRLQVSENKNTPRGKPALSKKTQIPTEFGNLDGNVLGPQNELVREGGNA